MRGITFDLEMKFIWRYTAKMHPKGSIHGLVEASTFTEAQQIVKRNEMVKSVSVVLHKNQVAARKQRYEV